MPTTILLIENDAGFAREITEALDGRGYQVRVTGDGKEGLDLAREIGPAAIVLCVELPRMSGYSICQKLKKDDALRGIPLVLTSAEATAETFEQHRKLKARAEDYLLKPYAPADLADKLVALTGQPEAPATTGEEEVVSLEEELGLGTLGGEPESELPALDLASLPDEPAHPGAAPAPQGDDEDLRLLDSAFDGLSAAAPAPARPAPPPPAEPSAGAALDLALEGERPVAADDVDAAAASLPDEDVAPAREALGQVADDADQALGALGDEGDAAAALDALSALDALDGPPAAAGPSAAPEPELDLDLSGPAAPPAPAPPIDLGPELAAALDLEPEAPAATRGADADALRAAGLRLLDEAPPSSPPALSLVRPPEARPAPTPLPDAAVAAELARLEADLADRRAALAARDAELRELHDRVETFTHRAMEAESALAEKEAEVASQRARAEALATQAKRVEADLKAGREDARKAADQVRAAEDRARAAEAQAAAAAERTRAAEAQAAAAAERTRAAEAQAAAAAERTRAAEAQAAAAAERTRAAEAQAAAAAEKAHAAEGRAQAAGAEADKHRAVAAEVGRSLEARVAELALAAAAATRHEATERELDELKTELIVARGEVEGARSEVEKRGTELKRRISELEAANTKNEERVVKAYLKIKGDEKVRDKARKALSIALQLLEEGLPPEPAQARPPSPAAKLE